MDCAVHPGAPAVDTCIKCQRAICAGCRQIVAGHAMCGFCVNAAQQQLQTPAAMPGFGAPPAQPGASMGGDDRSVQTAWTAAPVVAADPSVGRRILRAVGWGPLYGQWWTVWTVVSGFIWGSALKEGWPAFILGTVIMAFVYGFFGSVTGWIIALVNPDDEEKIGGGIGIGVGLTLCALEVFLLKDPAGLINVFFYFITGRYVGTGLAGRIMAPA
jgi:hypothetical protein